MPIPKAMVATTTMPSSQEALLVLVTFFLAHAGVIGQGIDAAVHQPGCGLIDTVAREAVNDTGLALVFGLDEVDELLARVVLLGDAVLDVGAVKAVDEMFRLGEVQVVDDFPARAFIGGGGQCDARYLGKAFLYQGQLQVVTAKIVAPL